MQKRFEKATNLFTKAMSSPDSLTPLWSGVTTCTGKRHALMNKDIKDLKNLLLI